MNKKIIINNEFKNCVLKISEKYKKSQIKAAISVIKNYCLFILN